MGKRIDVAASDFADMSLEASPQRRQPPRPDRMVGHLGQLGWCTLQMSAGAASAAVLILHVSPPTALPRSRAGAEGVKGGAAAEGRRDRGGEVLHPLPPTPRAIPPLDLGFGFGFSRLSVVGKEGAVCLLLLVFLFHFLSFREIGLLPRMCESRHIQPDLGYTIHSVLNGIIK